MILNSSSVSLPGLFRISLGIIVLPISCSRPDTPMSWISLSGSFICLARIIEIVATSTLCLKVYSSLVLRELISTAMASFSLMASMSESAIWFVACVSSSELVLLKMYWTPVDTRCLTLSLKVTLERSSVRSCLTMAAAFGDSMASGSSGSALPSRMYTDIIPSLSSEEMI